MEKIEPGWIKERPDIPVAQAAVIVTEYYGVQAAVIRELPGERDRNFYIRAQDGRECVLKIANALEKTENLDLQNQLFEHLAKNSPNLPSPRVIHAVSGESIITIQDQTDKSFLARLITYLPGRPLAEVQPHSPALLESLGRFLGQLDLALSDFSHPAARRPFHWRASETAGTIRRHRRP